MTAATSAMKGFAGVCAVATACALWAAASSAQAQSATRPVVSAGEASRAASDVVLTGNP